MGPADGMLSASSVRSVQGGGVGGGVGGSDGTLTLEGFSSGSDDGKWWKPTSWLSCPTKAAVKAQP